MQEKLREPEMTTNISVVVSHSRSAKEELKERKDVSRYTCVPGVKVASLEKRKACRDHLFIHKNLAPPLPNCSVPTSLPPGGPGAEVVVPFPP